MAYAAFSYYNVSALLDKSLHSILHTAGLMSAYWRMNRFLQWFRKSLYLGSWEGSQYDMTFSNVRGTTLDLHRL